MLLQREKVNKNLFYSDFIDEFGVWGNIALVICLSLWTIILKGLVT